jgi:Rhodopirellula transposase DDE domain
VLQELGAPETAGDPMSEQKWVRSSLRQLSRRVCETGHPARPPTVGRLLDDLGDALHVNAKKAEASAAHADRNAPFEHITAPRQACAAAGLPIISVDTKKKELIGNFKNAGQAWSQEAEVGNVHDFPQDALGRAVPYDLYDLLHNRGTVSVGSSADTPQFAVEAIARWWATEGCGACPQADQLLILADAGGSHGCRPRQWKYQLQAQVSDRFGLTVTVCHYPTGCSKGQPSEHRLFSHLSLNGAGKPLRTWDTMLGDIRGPTTTTGLEVHAFLQAGVDETGQSVSDADIHMLPLERHALCPNWNDTIRPRRAEVLDTSVALTNRDVIF